MMGNGRPGLATRAGCVFNAAAARRLSSEQRRPKLASELDGKAYLEKSLSSSTRKKLRQHRRRLSEQGALTSVVVSEPQAVRDALEQFLALEAAGWKGQRGTALLNDKTDAAFMRGEPAHSSHRAASINSSMPERCRSGKYRLWQSLQCSMTFLAVKSL